MTALATGLSSLLAAISPAIERLLGRQEIADRRLEDFARLGSDWFWETDATGRLLELPSMARTSRSGARLELAGRRMVEVHEHRDAAFDPLLDALAAHRDFSGVDLVHTSGGERRVLELSAHAMLDSSGSFIGFRGVGRDVTAERRSLNAARASEDKLRVLVDALPVCIAYVDRDLRYRLNNETFQAWFGVAPEHLQGRRIDTVLGETGFEESRPAIECALLGERVTLEESLLDARGTRRDVQTTMVPHWHDGEVVGLFVLLQDISDQKRRTDHLTQSGRHLAAVLDGLDAAIVVLEPSTTVSLVNAAWRTLERELTERDVGPRHRYGDVWARLSDDAPEDTRRVFAAVEAHARGDGPAVRADVRCPTGPAERWFAISTSDFLDAGERRVLVEHRDVSERTRLARLVRAQDSALARKVRLDSVGELAATIAHELNQPLTAIGNYAAIVDDMIARLPQADERLRDTLAGLVRETRRSGAIVHRVNNFVRQQPGDRRAVAAERIVRTAASWLAERMAEADVRFTIDADVATPAMLFVDVTQFEQVLFNLLGNAIDAIAEGDVSEGGGSGGAVSVGVTSNDDGKTVSLLVDDDGPGIVDAVRDTLFEPFVTSRSAGLGLGLAICRSIVETHGGRLWHEPLPGGGSRFGITLPAADANPAAVLA